MKSCRFNFSFRTLTLVAALLLTSLPSMASPIDPMTLIPADAVSVGMVRLSQMRTSQLTGRLFTETDKMTVDGDAKRFLLDAGLNPARDIDTVFAATSPREGSLTKPSVLVIAEGRFEVDRLSAALVSRGADTRTAGGVTYYVIEGKGAHHGEDERGAVAFLAPALAIAGNEEAVIEALTRKGTAGASFRSASIIGRELSRLDGNATAWAVVDVARAKRLGGARLPHSSSTPLESLAAAMKTISVIGVSGLDTGDGLRLSAFGISSDAETRQLLEDTLRGMTAAWRLAAQEKAPELVSALRRFEIGQTDDSVTIRGTIPASILKAAGQRMHQRSR